MDTFQLTDDAVERAARRLWELDGELMHDPRPTWDEVETDKAWLGVLDETRDAARSILEAAARG